MSDPLPPTRDVTPDVSVFTEAPTAPMPPASDERHRDARTPGMIGSYRPIRVLGEGGMGVVYEAEQVRPKRVVALKVIRPVVLNPSILKRFELEAEVLGRLQHPGIAQIYEAGTADSGAGPQPFFAMELVRGPRLDRYVAEKNLSTRGRVELMEKICDAIQYAHSKGVIHRDLKPGNILVDENGQPKVLDFGVARVTDSDVQATIQPTCTGQVLGTLQYMAPEQARGDVRDVDTAADVYALGVIAYELLVGRPPYVLSNRSLIDAIRVICDEEPTRMPEDSRTLRGDLQTVVRKALAKEKPRRYPTAAAFAADLRRYRNNEPIAARPPSTIYQVRKFAARNRALTTGIISLIVLLSAGLVGSLIALNRIRLEEKRTLAQKDVAEREREEAQLQAAIAKAVSGFQKDMLTSADPQKFLGEKVTVLQAAQSAVNELDAGKLKDEPLVEGAVRETIGATFMSLGRFDDAEPNLRKALDLHRHANAKSEIAASLSNLGSLLKNQGKLDEAEPMYVEALDIFRTLVPPPEQNIAEAINNLALLHRAQGKLPDAEKGFREALKRYRAALPANDPLIAQCLNNLAGLMKDMNRLPESEELYRESLAIYRIARAPGHPDIALGLNNLGVLLRLQEKYPEAEVAAREALELNRKALPAGHPTLAASLSNLASVYQSQDKFAEAEPLVREALEIRRKQLPPKHPSIAISLNNYAMLLRAQEKYAEAEAALREGVEILRESLPPGHRNTAALIDNLASVLNAEKKFAEAEPLFREALEMSRKSLGPEHPDTLEVQEKLAKLYEETGRKDQANALRAERPAPATRPTTSP